MNGLEHGTIVTFEPVYRNNYAQEAHAGDVVPIPAGVKHWHGAAKDSWFAGS